MAKRRRAELLVLDVLDVLDVQDVLDVLVPPADAHSWIQRARLLPRGPELPILHPVKGDKRLDLNNDNKYNTDV